MSEGSVYITAGGGRWHQRSDCEALAQGQQEALDKGMTNHPVQQVTPRSTGSRTACGWCVISDAIKEPDVAVADDLVTETEYERVFLTHVLRPLAELSSWKIESQRSISVSGQTYRPDFALTLPPLRIAIEIDGKDKGPGSADHDAWTRRQTALTNAGWEVLRFTNRQTMHEQEYCRRQIAVAVARLQERSNRPTPSPVPAPAPPVPAPPAPAQAAPSKAPALAAAAAVAMLIVGGLIWANSGDEELRPTRPTSGDRYPCPAAEPVKGNVTQNGDKIYHQPGQEFYNRTDPEECFADTTEASNANFRPSKR